MNDKFAQRAQSTCYIVDYINLTLLSAYAYSQIYIYKFVYKFLFNCELFNCELYSIVSFIFHHNLMKERKTWTKEEDEVLRLLRQTRGQKKWSTIARKMQEQFSISGRSGKQCRQRYHNHLDSRIKTCEWAFQEQKMLFQMHDQVGNRWSVISNRLPGRTDNCVKNHFYSKLRKAVRRINKIVSQKYKKQFKQIKTSLLYKIIETSQSKFKVSSMVDEQVADYCAEIKNKLYYFEENFQEDNQQHIQALKLLIQDILSFGKNNKRVEIKHRKSSGNDKDLLHPNMYLKKVCTNSDYSQSEVSSSRCIEFSSFDEQSDPDQDISITQRSHKSMLQMSKKQTNPSRTHTSNTNLPLTRSRSKQETFSSVKQPECFSDDVNLGQNLQFHTLTGDDSLNLKTRLRNPSFSQQKSDWCQYAIQQILMADNLVQQESNGSNRFSKNSCQNSLNRSHVNLFFQDSHFQMRILSPKKFAQQQKMSEQGQLFEEPSMEIQLDSDHYFADPIKTQDLGKQLDKLALQEKQVHQQNLKQSQVFQGYKIQLPRNCAIVYQKTFKNEQSKKQTKGKDLCILKQHF